MAISIEALNFAAISGVLNTNVSIETHTGEIIFVKMVGSHTGRARGKGIKRLMSYTLELHELENEGIKIVESYSSPLSWKVEIHKDSIDQYVGYIKCKYYSENPVLGTPVNIFSSKSL